MAEEVKSKKGTFTFGIMIFSLCFLLPMTLLGMFGFWLKNEQEVKLKCLEQGKTYVNQMCLTITPSTK